MDNRAGNVFPSLSVKAAVNARRHLVRSVLHVPPVGRTRRITRQRPNRQKSLPARHIRRGEDDGCCQTTGRTASCSPFACGREGNESGRCSVRSCPTYFWTQQHGVICKWSHSQSVRRNAPRQKENCACAHARHRAILSPPPRCCGMVLRGVDFAWSISFQIFEAELEYVWFDVSI